MTMRWVAPALCLALGMAVPARAQRTGGAPRIVVLQASTTVTASADGTTTFGLGSVRTGLCVLDVTNVSGTLPTLDVYLQAQPDGTTDSDYVHFAQAIAASKIRAAFNVYQASPASAAVTDGTAGVQNGAGPLGDRLKVRAVVGGTTPSFTYTVTCSVSDS